MSCVLLETGRPLSISITGAGIAADKLEIMFARGRECCSAAQYDCSENGNLSIAYNKLGIHIYIGSL